MNCPQCQAPNQPDSAFCANCGARLAPAGAPAPPGGYYPQPGQGTPVGYGSSGGTDTPGYGAPSGYGQQPGTSAGQYPPAGQYSPAGQYPPPQQPPAGYPQGGGQYQPRPAGQGIPPFQFDLKRLTRVDQIVAGASLITLISLFLPWFTETVSVGAFGAGSASESGTDAHGWLWLVFVLDLVIIAYFVMRAGWEESPVRLPIAHAPLLIIATGLQLLLVLIAFLDMPGNDGISSMSIGWAWGAFIGLLAALAAGIPVLWPAGRSYIDGRRQR